MKKSALFLFSAMIVLSSCVSKKKFKNLKEKQQKTATNLEAARTKLQVCNSKVSTLEDRVSTLKNTNHALLSSQNKLVTLSKQGAKNLGQSLQRLQEKSLKIESLREAVNKRDSVTLALVTSLKGALDGMHGNDIQISVDKGVVFVSISDNLLFDSASYEVSPKAMDVLKKVAKVVKSKPNFEFMVEGHTDAQPIQTKCIDDNWELSTLRAVSIVRILQNKFNVEPSRMVAAGRGEYHPVATNETAAGRAQNRRTRIVVLPKLGQFYGMIEEQLKDLEKKSKKKEKK